MTSLLLIVALGAAACGGTRRIEVPSTLPNVTHHSFLTLRWALVRQGGTARAVGVVESSSATPWDAGLELLGLDAAGKTVSRRPGGVQAGFTPGPTPFEVTLTETGQETGFQLRVTFVQQNSRNPR